MKDFHPEAFSGDVSEAEPSSSSPTQQPRREFSPDRDLPQALKALNELSANYFWSWRPEGQLLFRDLDPQLWDECEQNPRVMLKSVSELRLLQKATDSGYVARLARFRSELGEYLSATAVSRGIVTPENPAAYFCAEYGVHNSLPTYSGGLGILAGDHLKSASDMNVPLVAVGLLYRYGYFRQRIAHTGWQEEAYQDVFESELAIQPVLHANGDRVTVAVTIRGREVGVQAWRARVGRIDLYLLDTNVDPNEEIDRLITGHLYGGSSETRVVQEKVLGIGGVRLLRKLGVDPSVYHLNEGHSAFLTLELAREYLAAHPEAEFSNALDVVREKCVFTTHTPVSAGNDAFSPELLRDCFDAQLIADLKLSESSFFALGRTDPQNEEESFGMTPLAVRMCRSTNGVSRKHGEVSRQLWASMFSETADVDDVPITHVTNGVHSSTWIAPVFQDLFAQMLGDRWRSILDDPQAWKQAVTGLSAEKIWSTHVTLKRILIAFLRQRTRRADTGAQHTINEHANTDQLLSPEILTIGFARRVAAYKRWNLILSDVERLLRLVDHAERPVQFVFAGKAHPQDRTAKQILQELMSINNDSNWQNRAVFIEDYDQEVARYLVHGVDVWMNVPRRPMEASGTSGMKAAMNGVLNFSILDGWWIEGFNGKNGFAIGDLDVPAAETEDDAADADALYTTLENDVVPAFYETDESGLPMKWIERMKDSIATLTPQFSSDRMLEEYLRRIYNP